MELHTDGIGYNSTLQKTKAEKALKKAKELEAERLKNGAKIQRINSKTLVLKCKPQKNKK